MKKLVLALIFCICTLHLFAQITNTPSDYLICSSDPGVEIAVFDLSVKTLEIIEGLDPENFTISYYLSLQDADNMINPLPQFFTNFTNPQTIFVSVMDNSTGNLDITSFDLIVSVTPFFSINTVSICEGSTTEIDTGLDPSQYIFFWSTNETSSSILISEPGSYWVSVSNLDGCTSEIGFEVTFGGNLDFNEPNPLFGCSLDGNGFAEFDLTQATQVIVGNQTDLSVTYYASLAEAEAGMTSIANEAFYINTIPFNQVLYARIEDTGSSCFSIAPLELVVSVVEPIPVISDFVICDEDQDGFELFSLQFKNEEVLANQSNFNLSVSYHLTEADAVNLANPLPDLYTNISNPQTIFVAVSDFNFCTTQIQSFNLVADQTCEPCQTIVASIESTIPEPNNSGVIVVQIDSDITFNGSATFSGDGADAIYSWDFGDNTFATGIEISHFYLETGTYTVTLTVTDNNPEGCSNSTTIEVIVLGGNLLVDESAFTVEELVQNILIGNDCSQISNITYSTGNSFSSTEPNGIGYFVYEGNDFPYREGLLISTGSANDAAGPNVGESSSGTTNWPGDNDLDIALGIQSNNATSIEFDFVPVVDQINFDFLMASEEYDGGNFECEFSDAFAFLLTDASGNTTNLALIPGTDLPITITNIHNANDSCAAANPEFFGGYTDTNAPPIGYNGRTVSFSAQAAVNSGETYHIKLVIADDVDTFFDSAVFFKAGSFDVGGICEDIGLISMRAFNDTNTNGDFDADETRFTNGSFTYEKNNDGIVNVVNSSTGAFTIISTDESDSYDITFAVNDTYSDCFSQSVLAFDDVNVAFGEFVQVDFPINDNLICEDLAVYLVNPFASPRPGFEHTNLLILENLSGAEIVSGTIEFVVDANLTVSAISLSNTNMNLTTTATGFTLDFANLLAGESESVEITMLCPVTVALDEIVTNTATYVTTADDTIAENNLSTLSEIVIGSYDPNDKMEAQGPEIIYDDFITSDEYLYYTIRFQNIGTAEAIFVRIEDELDVQLDESTFEMLRSSDDYVVTRTGNSLEWFFDHINLPAEEDDAEGSIGYVYFKIKPKSGYGVGDIIPNSAAIYFDFNAPIITNNFNTTFVEPLSVTDFERLAFEMYPNPAKTSVTLKLSSIINGNTTLKIYDVQGKVILQQKLGNVDFTQLDISALQSGLYFVELGHANYKQIEKLVIE